MGSESWTHWQTWKKDLRTTLRSAKRAALEELGYDSEEEAREATEADGTASPIDIFGFEAAPLPGHCHALTARECKQRFGTDKPGRAAIEEHEEALLEELGRGESIAVIAWERGKRCEVFFGGWSFD